MEQTVNQFTKGLQTDTHPLIQGQESLTDCLNGTLVTMNGNELILQNDMGNRRINNAFLPSGYEPVGMKEYGGVIYVAAYNPITNHSQIGSFPSPQRKVDIGNDCEAQFDFDEKFNKNNYTLDDDLKINTINNDSYLQPLTETNDLHVGDIFTVYSANKELEQGISELKDNLSNYNNIKIEIEIEENDYIHNINNGDYRKEETKDENGNTINKYYKKIDKVFSPKNRTYTIQLGVLNNVNNVFHDITKDLVRWDSDDKIIKNLENKSDLYKFNIGYFIPDKFVKDRDINGNTINDSNLIINRKKIAANTYSYKLSGPLYLKIIKNHVNSFNYGISGHIIPNSLMVDDYEIVFTGYFNYNCPDGVTSKDEISDQDYYTFEEGIVCENKNISSSIDKAELNVIDENSKIRMDLLNLVFQIDKNKVGLYQYIEMYRDQLDKDYEADTEYYIPCMNKVFELLNEYMKNQYDQFRDLRDYNGQSSAEINQPISYADEDILGITKDNKFNIAAKDERDPYYHLFGTVYYILNEDGNFTNPSYNNLDFTEISKSENPHILNIDNTDFDKRIFGYDETNKKYFYSLFTDKYMTTNPDNVDFYESLGKYVDINYLENFYKSLGELINTNLYVMSDKENMPTVDITKEVKEYINYSNSYNSEYDRMVTLIITCYNNIKNEETGEKTRKIYYIITISPEDWNNPDNGEIKIKKEENERTYEISISECNRYIKNSVVNDQKIQIEEQVRWVAQYKLESQELPEYLEGGPYITDKNGEYHVLYKFKDKIYENNYEQFYYYPKTVTIKEEYDRMKKENVLAEYTYTQNYTCKVVPFIDYFKEIINSYKLGDFGIELDPINMTLSDALYISEQYNISYEDVYNELVGKDYELPDKYRSPVYPVIPAYFKTLLEKEQNDTLSLKEFTNTIKELWEKGKNEYEGVVYNKDIYNTKDIYIFAYLLHSNTFGRINSDHKNTDKEQGIIAVTKLKYATSKESITYYFSGYEWLVDYANIFTFFKDHSDPGDQNYQEYNNKSEIKIEIEENDYIYNINNDDYKKEETIDENGHTVNKYYKKFNGTLKEFWLDLLQIAKNKYNNIEEYYILYANYLLYVKYWDEMDNFVNDSGTSFKTAYGYMNKLEENLKIIEQLFTNKEYELQSGEFAGVSSLYGEESLYESYLEQLYYTYKSEHNNNNISRAYAKLKSNIIEKLNPIWKKTWLDFNYDLILQQGLFEVQKNLPDFRHEWNMQRYTEWLTNGNSKEKIAIAANHNYGTCVYDKINNSYDVVNTISLNFKASRFTEFLSGTIGVYGWNQNNKPTYIKNLSSNFYINLKLISSGYLTLTQYRFYNNSNNTVMFLSFDSYPKEGESFENLTLKFTDITDESSVYLLKTEQPILHGKQIITFFWNDSVIKENDGTLSSLEPRTTYRVKILYDLKTEEGIETKEYSESIERWFLTTSLFNSLIAETSIPDFCDTNSQAFLDLLNITATNITDPFDSDPKYKVDLPKYNTNDPKGQTFTIKQTTTFKANNSENVQDVSKYPSYIKNLKVKINAQNSDKIITESIKATETSTIKVRGARPIQYWNAKLTKWIQGWVGFEYDKENRESDNYTCAWIGYNANYDANYYLSKMSVDGDKDVVEEKGTNWISGFQVDASDNGSNNPSRIDRGVHRTKEEVVNVINKHHEIQDKLFTKAVFHYGSRDDGEWAFRIGSCYAVHTSDTNYTFIKNLPDDFFLFYYNDRYDEDVYKYCGDYKSKEYTLNVNYSAQLIPEYEQKSIGNLIFNFDTSKKEFSVEKQFNTQKLEEQYNIYKNKSGQIDIIWNMKDNCEYINNYNENWEINSNGYLIYKKNTPSDVEYAWNHHLLVYVKGDIGNDDSYEETASIEAV